MCGIVGYFSNKNNDDSLTFTNVLKPLIHRGPDCQNFFYERPVYLGHTRLSIIDLTADANQPMFSDDKRYVIVYNGEVYNFKEIAKKYNIQAKTQSDTEIILKSFLLLGNKAVSEFNGMFAVAIYDRIEKKITFFRDRIGKKPLFYYHNKNIFAFASEIKALLNIPEIAHNLTLNYKAIHYYLHLGYIPEPLTIYNEINKFPSAHVGVYSNNSLVFETYWKIEDYIKKEYLSDEKEALEQLRHLLTNSVKYRLISDVPYGLFLSGGVDSSIIAAIAQQLTGNLKTFTIGFEEQKYNEAPFAKTIADYLKTDHTEYILRFDEAIQLIDQYLELFDEPFADSSALPTMLVSKLAKKDVTVVLSGDGGDELFWGYGAYRWTKRIHHPIIHTVHHPIRYILQRGNSRFKRVSKLFDYSENDFIPAHIFSQEQYFFTTKEIKQLINKEIAHELYFRMPQQTERMLSKVELQSWFDLNYYLKDDLLVKVDRASMRYSLEVRSPLLDFNIVQFAFNLSPELKHRNDIDKYILKQLLYQYIPSKYFMRRKWGFSIPLNKWMKNEWKDKLYFLLSKHNLQKYPFIQYSFVENMLKKFEQGDDYLYGRLWNLMVLIDFLDRKKLI
ncbi:MAG: asparagine synthase (glutamine-hydrolyzing) [Bacteroidales bacterium]|nr:asparagine synthase (glutamine-hydrolyzing) [Bacteroidales bacterium]